MTRLISAFPGTGKSYYFRNSEKDVLDSDSSTFDKSEFPSNYIAHIKANMGNVDEIMISSHKEVRDALIENDLPFTLVYPHRSLKEEYVQRYIERGSPEAFINLVKINWDSWMDEMEEQKDCDHIVLQSGQYISDII